MASSSRSTEPAGPAVAADSPRVWVPPPLIYGGCVAFAWWLGPRFGASFSAFVPTTAARAAGALLLAAGLVFDLWALGLFVRSRTSALPFRPARAIVAEGPYRWTRNPMYLGMTLSVLGAGLLLDRVPVAVAALVAAAIVDRWVIPREERYLESRFGDRYLELKRRVRRWL
ncbi:MAG: isoprenylcysteine carboxylmethyltransferase family protein [Acidobacteria bacterium]|nr:isoprenylcysteine carboxylmethyltransferase family protein [Acidobacteriota bacterium]